jgi:hypothetical protein
MSELARSVDEVLTRLIETLPEGVARLERVPADDEGRPFRAQPIRRSG